MATDRQTNGERVPDVRSKVTNGSKMLSEVDGRSAPARRYRDLIHLITSDLGGADQISEAEQQLVRRAAGLSVCCELTEASLVNEEPINGEDYVRAINGLVRVLSVLGLKRRPRDVTPRLADYLAASDINERTVEVDGEDRSV